MFDYQKFIDRKRHQFDLHGFDPVWMPDFLYPFQRSLVEWATRKGRAAMFCDCGLGKTPMQLVWSENVTRKTGGRVLILTPLAVSYQTIQEAEKFGIEAHRSHEGEMPGQIIVTNYERLHYHDPSDYVGIVCDESSILKNYKGKTKTAITRFASKMSYRLLCTATAAPNDYVELGTSSEALGELGYIDMLQKFFTSRQKTSAQGGSQFGRFFDGNEKFRFRGHAEEMFWRWVCSWARACRKPSDLGFDDNGFILPPKEVIQHTVKAAVPRDGYMFDLAAVGLSEQREERRRTINERCGMVADLVDHQDPAVVWCHLNSESQKLKSLIPGAVEVKGSDTDEHKERSFRGFQDGSIRVLVTKPTIAGFGLNWQHCAHQTFFPSHSFEQWYQGIRRCWRFGQKSPVRIDIVTSEGEERVLSNMQAKEKAASDMFDALVRLMADELRIDRKRHGEKKERVPEWL